MISDKTYKALCFLRDYPQASMSSFAQHMWPGHRMHTKTSNQGNGATRGKAAWLCAGSYIGRLKKAKYVSYSFNLRQYFLSDVGRKAIEEYETKNKKNI